MKRPDPLRQSKIQRFDACSLSLKLEEETPVRQPSNLAARGTLFHRWVAWALEHMKAHGERYMPVELGMSKLLDICAQLDIPSEDVVHLPMRDYAWLRIAVTRFCENGPFNSQRIMAIEERLEGTILVPDGQGGFYERRLSGHPDVLVADPPEGVICVDWKTGWAPPSKVNEDSAIDPDSGEQREGKITDAGYVQQVVYGLLILQNYPVVQRVTLREFYLLFGEYREATIYRRQLERISDIVSAVIAQMDRAYDEGPDSDRWLATAGMHCSICPAPHKCPIKDWTGIPETAEEALQVGREWIVAGEVRKERLPLVKGWVDANGPIELDHSKGKRVIGWKENSTGNGRRFTVYEPEDAPESPWDRRLAEAAEERNA